MATATTTTTTTNVYSYYYHDYYLYYYDYDYDYDYDNSGCPFGRAQAVLDPTRQDTLQGPGQKNIARRGMAQQRNAKLNKAKQMETQ